jgi:hypothetical protein
MPGLDSNTKLLIHANAGVAAGEFAQYKLNDNAANTTVTDSGSGANNGTASTNTSNLTTTGKINQAFAFNGTTQYVNMDSIMSDIKSDTKGTISLWIKPTDTTGPQYVFLLSKTATPTISSGVFINGAEFAVQIYNQSSNYSYWVTTGASVTAGVWQHFAVVQDGISLRIYKNGVDITPTPTLVGAGAKSDWFSVTSASVDNGRLGCWNYGGVGNTEFFEGSVDDLRYYQNIALGQEAIQAIYNAGNGTETSLIYDSSASAHPITGYGNVYIAPAVPDPTNAKLVSGDGNAFFNGTSANLTAPDDADWYFGTGNFTIEFWLYLNDIPAQFQFIGQWADGSNYWRCEMYANKHIYMSFIFGGATIADYRFISLLVPGKWYHLAFVRNGVTGLIFLDGVSQFVTESTAFGASDVGNVAAVLSIGAKSASGATSMFYSGYMDEIRISKGIARYTSNFTPSTRFTADSYTKLLLHFDSDITTDSETTPKTVTNNSVVWNAGSKWNSGALSFDGTGDYAVVPNSSDFDIAASDTTDRTVDFQFNLAVDPAGTTGAFLYYQDPNYGSDDNYWRAVVVDDNDIRFTLKASSTDIPLNLIYTTALPIKTWHHYAIIKTGLFYGMYINGIQVNYGWAGKTVTVPSGQLGIGYRPYLAALPFNGSLDEVRIQHSNYFSAAPNSFPAAPLLIYGDSVKQSYAKFNGTNATLSAPDSADWYFASGDFTIDFWASFASTAAYNGFYYQYQSSTEQVFFEWGGLNSPAGTYGLRFIVRTGGTNVISMENGNWTPVLILGIT